MEDELGRRERRARVLGVAAALLSMAAASLAIGWPAPGVSVALGFAVYFIARGVPDRGGER